MNAHTPGPWGYSLGSVIDREGYLIADVRSRFDAGKENEDYHHANARLIAAAPDLLAALKAIADTTCNHGPNEVCCRDLARRAIARARGEL